MKLSENSSINKRKLVKTIRERVRRIVLKKDEYCDSSVGNTTDLLLTSQKSNIKLKEKFIDSQAYITRNKLMISYYVPTINKSIIEFTKKQNLELDKIVLLNDFSPPNYSKDDNCFFDKEGKIFTKAFAPVSKRRSQRITNDKSCKNAIKAIKSLKSANLRKNKSVVLEAIFNKVALNKICDITTEKSNCSITYCIKDFDWMNKPKIQEMLSEHFDKTNPALKFESNALIYKDNFTEEEKVAYLAEIKYGSWCDLMESEVDTEEKKEFTKSYISKRTKAILFLIQNPILDLKDCSEYNDQMISFIVDEMNKPVINLNGQNVVGWQRDVRYSKDQIEEYLFEALLNLNSSLGRMVTLENWESLISHPNFVKQSSYENVFGFIIDNHSKQTSILNKYSGKISRDVKEIKLYLVSQIRNQIKKLVNQFKPILSWRILVEKYLQLEQNYGFYIERNENGEEEDAYMLLVCNMYLLSLMKYDGFNPERHLRLKFHCSKCESNETLKSLCHSCLCCYGFDLYTIERTLLKGDQRKEIMKRYIMKNFSFEKEKEVFKPKSDIIDSIKKSFDKKVITKDGVECIEKKLKIKIEI